MSLLTFDRVTMTATTGVVEILKDLSFSVELGDFIALVGPSGAGKTSLLRLMNRLAEASSGQILLEGENIRQLSAVSLRQQVMLVNQESRLLGMTVKETLAYPLRLRRRSASEIIATVDEWIEKMKIPTDWLDRQAVNLSLGQRQRVAIARALVSRPKIVLADEPTASLDSHSGRDVVNLSQQLSHQQHCTVLMVTHDNRILDIAERSLHMEDGRLCA